MCNCKEMYSNLIELTVEYEFDFIKSEIDSSRTLDHKSVRLKAINIKYNDGFHQCFDICNFMDVDQVENLQKVLMDEIKNDIFHRTGLK